jgi:hypothetical protein
MKTRNKFIIIFASFIVAIAILFVSIINVQVGVGLLAMLLFVSGLAALWWCFTRRPPPEGDCPVPRLAVAII